MKTGLKKLLLISVFSALSCAQPLSLESDSTSTYSSDTFISSSEETDSMSPLPNSIENLYRKTDATEDPREWVSVNTLFLAHKFKGSEGYISLMSNPTEWNLEAESNLVGCFAKKDILEEMISSLTSKSKAESSISDLRLRDYLIYTESKKKEDSKVLTKEIAVKEETIDRTEGEYYLIDVYRKYFDSECPNKGFIYQVPFISEENTIAVDFAALESEQINLFCPYFSKKKEASLYSLYFLLYVLDYKALRIETEGSLKVVKERFTFTQSYEQEDPSFYDELKECIVSMSPFNQSSDGGTQDTYDVVFDYKKLMDLFLSDSEELQLQ